MKEDQGIRPQDYLASQIIFKVGYDVSSGFWDNKERDGATDEPWDC